MIAEEYEEQTMRYTAEPIDDRFAHVYTAVLRSDTMEYELWIDGDVVKSGSMQYDFHPGTAARAA